MFPSKPILFLLRLIKIQRYLLIKGVLLGFFVSALEGFGTSLIMLLLQKLGSGTTNSAQLPKFISILNDVYAIFPQHWHLALVIITLLGLTIIKNVLLYLSNISINNLQLKVGMSIRRYCIERFLKLEIPFYSRSNLGELVNYVNEHAQRSEILSSRLIEIVREIIGISAFLVVLIFLSPILTIIVIISLTIVFFLLKTVLKFVQFYGKKAAHSLDEFSLFITELLTGIRVVKSFTAEYREMERADKYLHKRYAAEFTGFKYDSAVFPLTETAGITILLVLLALGSWFFADAGNASLPLLLTFTYTVLRMSPRINNLNSLRSQLALLSGSLETIYGFLLSTDGLDLADGQRVYTGLKSGITFENLTFTFPANSEPTLKEVNFKLEKGTTTAIVGPSGSGKSTLVDLIMRFHAPDSGSIKIDGIDLREYQIISWRKAIAMVSQDNFLFHTSIRENIAYGRPDATDIEVIAAAKKAYAYEFIQDLPQGFATIVGDRGARLSGGQRQRIAIARAILCDPDILILDEATSALDSNSERIVQKAIEEISRDRTVIVIAHRLSTIENANKIVVINEGQVVEQGTHQELLALQGNYWFLYKSQTSVDEEVIALG